jgi:hypothetical protein
MWRGNSLEQLEKHSEALKDYLRGLLACAYHDLSGGWPEIRQPKVSFDRRSDEPQDIQRARDYQMYRKRMDFQRSLITQRYFFIEAVNRVQPHLTVGDDQLLKILEELSPDTSRFAPIMKLVESENQRPWP